MAVSLVKASDRDAELIFTIQVKAFKPMLDIYKDYETNPATETINRTKMRITNPTGGFYKIVTDDKVVGAICVYSKEPLKYWISPMFILPSYQGNGIAQEAIALIEKLFPEATSWELATLLEEKRNCYLYEKMGYIKTGVSKKLNESATLIFYRKILK